MFFYTIEVWKEGVYMAHNEYYTFDQGSVNGKVSMNIRVFDEIVKKYAHI